MFSNIYKVNHNELSLFMQQLNLPSFKYKLKKEKNKTFIWDVLRKKYIFLTPEEWVRQHFIHYLISDLKYSAGMIAIEKGHQLNSVIKRTDLMVYNSDGKVEILIELKAPEVKIDQKVLTQISIYNQEVNAKYFVISNGIDSFCFSVKGKEIKQLKEIPANS